MPPTASPSLCRRRTRAKELLPCPTPQVFERLRDAEVVLGLVGRAFSPTCRLELGEASRLRKHMIVMTDPAATAEIGTLAGPNVITIDPTNPGASEVRIVEHLKQIDAQQNAKTALLALGTLVLGLLILAPSEKN